MILCLSQNNVVTTVYDMSCNMSLNAIPPKTKYCTKARLVTHYSLKNCMLILTRAWRDWAFSEYLLV